jgi:hypothetical protein
MLIAVHSIGAAATHLCDAYATLFMYTMYAVATAAHAFRACHIHAHLFAYAAQINCTLYVVYIHA